MTWKERRIISILVGILLVLSIALVVVLAGRYRTSRAEGGEQQPSSADIAVSADPQDFATLEYYNGAVTLSFIRGEEGNWLWEGSDSFPLDETVVTGILDQLTGFSPVQTLKGIDIPEETGLRDSEMTLTASTVGGDTVTLLFGSETEGGHYVQLNGDETTLYVLDDRLYDLMQVTVYEMCILPQLPDLSQEALESVTISGGYDAGTFTRTSTLSALRAEGDLMPTWRSNGANVTDLPQVQALMEDLKAMAPSQCISYRPSEEAVELCGFEAPLAQLTAINQAGETVTLTIGNLLPDESARYIRLEGDSTIYALPNELSDSVLQLAQEGV